MSSMSSRAAGFPPLLKAFRNKRGISQLQLAHITGYSQRHISFLEIGRSQPTRGAVLALAEAVCDTLEERNAMLRAAKFADEYPRSPLDAEELQRVLATCQRTLDGLAPFPAILIDARWEVLAVNSAAIAFFGQFQRQRRWEGGEQNALRTHFEPGGLRPHIVDWPRVAHHFMTKARLRLLQEPTNDVAAGIVRDFGKEVSALSVERSPASGAAFTIEVMLGAAHYRYQTLFAAMSDPQDRAAEDLRIEAFVPADNATRHHFEALGGAVEK